MSYSVSTQIGFTELVRLQEVHVYETCAAGAVVTIEARDTDNNLIDVWSTPSPSFITTARIFTPLLYLSIIIKP